MVFYWMVEIVCFVENCENEGKIDQNLPHLPHLPHLPRLPRLPHLLHLPHLPHLPKLFPTLAPFCTPFLTISASHTVDWLFESEKNVLTSIYLTAIYSMILPVELNFVLNAIRIQQRHKLLNKALQRQCENGTKPRHFLLIC